MLAWLRDLRTLVADAGLGARAVIECVPMYLSEPLPLADRVERERKE